MTALDSPVQKPPAASRPPATLAPADVDPTLQACGLAAWAAALLAVDPNGVGGVWLRSGAGPARDAWMAALSALLPAGTPMRRLPLQVDDARLLGGLDLGATLRSGRPVSQPGLLAQADGGVVVLAMAERVSAGTAARLGAVLDRGEVAMERDGMAQLLPARLAVIALDEGRDDDEAPPPALLDRLGLAVALHGGMRPEQLRGALGWSAADIADARRLLPAVQHDESILQALCGTALSLGIVSMRPACLALRVAHAAAALDRRDHVSTEDAELAAQLVFAPRATRLPVQPQAADAADDASDNDEQTADESPPPPADATNGEEETDNAAEKLETPDASIDDQVLQAARAAIPPGLLARLAAADAASRSGRAAGKAGALQHHALRGRPIGARRGEPRGGARLDLLQTLRAAAPWQRLRDPARAPLRDGTEDAGRAWTPDDSRHAGGPRVHVRREDFHVRRFKQRRQTCTVFAVDASGSAALHRLAEAKGAVELLLAECYVRRDRVALIAFRGTQAELLLPPTRSLVRAKRSLAGLPGGGATPLAAGILGAAELARAIERSGETAVVVLLTDGRANIALDGASGRDRAHQDALVAARRLREWGVAAVLLDIGAQPQPQARDIAVAMGARYFALPHAQANAMAQAVSRVRGR